MAKSRGWSTPPSMFADAVEEALTQRVRVIALAMLNEIVLRSPVDTGRFRGNNIVSIGAPVYVDPGYQDKNGSETVRRGLSALSGLEPFTQVFLQNSLPYAEAIENGHSKQAPSGVYSVSFHSVSQAYS
ncbi:hypothetical protein [Pseudomonas sp. NBRC 111128]|uniref:hypothetical protein n=1 Tax=Pseudomonas sp. NBRC 111128 TaxID=1661043 RepID=UPI0006D41AA7|nr:hypothetical protein [Pseudomonas sp. NBRC 111128]